MSNIENTNSMEISAEVYDTDFDDVAFEPEKVADDADYDMANKLNY